MKKIILLATCFSLIAVVSFAQRPAAAKPKSTPSEDTIQYSLGVYMMQQLLAKTGFLVTDANLFKKAIDDVINKKPLMVNPATTEARLLAYQDIYQSEKNRRLEVLLMDKVKQEKGFTALPSGVYYSVVKAGTGIRPSAVDTVILNVICTLPDGTEVDNFNKTKQSYMSLAGEMIPGLKDVLFRMGEGAIVRAIIPAAQAYGSQGTLTIPKYSAVIYDVALVSVKQAK